MDAQQFAQAVRDHGDRLYSYGVWMLRDHGAAEDLAQEAFMRLWKHKSKVDEGAARAWLLRTASRLCIDRARSRAASPGRSALPEDVLPAPSPDDPPELAERKAALAACFPRLGTRDQSLLHLHDVQGLSSADLGRALGMGDGAVRVAVHRARRRLLELIEMSMEGSEREGAPV